MKVQNMTSSKVKVLADYLGCDVEDITEGYEWYGKFMTLEDGAQEYLILDDDEANEAVVEYIKETAWAFNASFLANYTDLPIEVFEAMQEKFEDSNDVVLQCIKQKGDIEDFAEDVVSEDGRGHFLSSYDGEEVKEDGYFIYRLN